jgi:hypothetical protein
MTARVILDAAGGQIGGAADLRSRCGAIWPKTHVSHKVFPAISDCPGPNDFCMKTTNH